MSVGNDWTAAIQHINDNPAFSVIVLDVPIMNSDVELRPAPYTIIMGMGGILHVTAVSNKQSGIRANTGVRVIGRLTIDMADVGAENADWRRAHISLGAYAGDLLTTTTQSVTDVHISGITLTGGHYDINGVFVTSASQRCTFTDFYIPDNALMGRAFLAHWGSIKANTITRNTATGVITWDGTALLHPNNIKCERWVIDQLTAGYDTADRSDKATAFHISAGYNIEIDQVTIKQCNNVCRIVGADWGFNYAVVTEIVANKSHGNSLKNVMCSRAAYRGLDLDGLTTRDSSGNPYTSELVFNRTFLENIRISGIRTITSGSHIAILNSVEDVTFANVSFLNGASTGLYITGPSTRIRGDVKVTNVNSNALRIVATLAANASDIHLILKSTIENAAANNDQLTGSAVYLAACNNIVIDGSIGNVTSASTYFHGVYIESTCADIDIGLCVGQVSASFGGKSIYANSSAYSQRLRIDRATIRQALSISGAFISRGPNGSIIIHAAAAPTTGSWTQGDITVNNNPLAGQPAGWTWSAAGAWRPWANLG